MKGAEVYIDASKDTWRGWKWNAIARAALLFNDRLPPSERARRLSQKTVLYLVGPEDNDRQKALAKGFANHNLIAVDIQQERIDEVRASGGLGICAPLQQVIRHWPLNWPIDIVDADMCSGFVADIRALAFCMFSTPVIHGNSVVSMNLMRGRDQHSNEIRNLCKFAEMLLPDGRDCEHDIVKHRGGNWLMNICFHIHRLNAVLEDKCYPKGFIGLEPALVRSLWDSWRPAISSYRSKTSNQYFDSVVHRWGVEYAWVDGAPGREFWESMKDCSTELLSPSCADDDGVRERIAAIRAVRTKKARSSP